MSRDPRSFTIPPTATLRQAAACIDRGRCGIAVVVDDAGRVVDTITDGDVRRALLAGTNLDVAVATLASRRKGTAYEVPVVAPVSASRDDHAAILRTRQLRQLPLVDEDGAVVDVVTVDDVEGAGELPVRAVVMAGGFGKRLGDLTKDTPKPMLKVGDRPLLEHIVTQLRDAGIHKMSVTTHFKADVITQHFGDGAAFGVDISYVAEDVPLGTAGALGLLPSDSAREPLLVMNGDILTRIDVGALLRFHQEHRADLTVAVRQYEVAVPFGVVDADGPVVTGIREKPTTTFLVNAGIYLLEPHVLSLVTPGARLDMPDLITRLLAEQRRVVSFPVLEYWLDIGRVDDYARASDDVAGWGRAAARPAEDA